jgi:hypothetical protein
MIRYDKRVPSHVHVHMKYITRVLTSSSWRIATECSQTFHANVTMIGSRDNQQLHAGSELRMILV